MLNSVSIYIPHPYAPMDRGWLFEDPVMDAIEEAGIECDWIGAGGDGEGCDFAFEVGELKRALDIIFEALKTTEAPSDTVIVAAEPDETGEAFGVGKEYRLGDLVRGE